jgi:hypothetical protein
MHTVCETAEFRRAASQSGMTEQEIAALIVLIASDPGAGDAIEGSGGCRKVRFAGRGKGKSGGYRTITFYAGARIPVFLLTVFAKGDRANLSKAEVNALRKITKAIVASYRARGVT